MKMIMIVVVARLDLSMSAKGQADFGSKQGSLNPLEYANHWTFPKDR
jgi:hypothetical protein